MDQYMEFCQEIPSLMGDDGYPKSWRHFVYGMAYVRRLRARRMIMMNDAHRMTKVDERSYREWRSIQEDAAGF